MNVGNQFLFVNLS